MATKTKVRGKAKTRISDSMDVEAKTIASTKVAACIAAQNQAQVNLVSKKRATCEAIRSEANRLGIADDKKAIRKMVLASWVLAFPDMAKAPEAVVKRFIERSQPDVSKIMMLAYPVNDHASKELKAAFDFNDALATDTPKAERLGEGRLIDIARDQLTLKQALATKEHKKQSRNLDTVVSPFDRIKNAFAKVIADAKVNGKERVTEADCKRAFNEALVAWLAPSAKK